MGAIVVLPYKLKPLHCQNAVPTNLALYPLHAPPDSIKTSLWWIYIINQWVLVLYT